MMRTCQGCGKEIVQGPTRPRKWCSEGCRRHTCYSGACVDCGAKTYNGTTTPPHRCKTCSIKRTVAIQKENAVVHREVVEQLWAEGKTYREICDAMGWKGSRSHVSVLRSLGYDLPHRRTPEQVARMTAGSEAALRKGRAIWRGKKAAA